MRIYLSLAISLFLSASALDASITTFFYEGVDSPGNTFSSISTDTKEHCAEACWSNELCSLAVFDSTKTCALKNKTSGYETTTSSTMILKIISGQNNVDILHGDYNSIHTDTWDECSRACFVDEPCKAFTFNKTTGACWLKDEILFTDPNNPNAMSGVR